MAEKAGASSTDAIQVRHCEGVAWITLNRPERLNAFVGTMRDDLHDAIAESAEQASTRVIVITGAGRAFCAGADVGTMAELLREEDEETFAGFVEAGMRVVQRIRSIPLPVIAAVNGVAAGAGAALAIACDFRIATDTASIGFTFNRIGLHADWGATYFLPRLVGAGRAAELLLTGRILSAAEAAQVGVFEQVVAQAEFSAEVETLAAELGRKPPVALAALKETLAHSLDSDLHGMLERERAAQLRCFRTQDVREGIGAFQEKRPPVFRGE